MGQLLFGLQPPRFRGGKLQGKADVGADLQKELLYLRGKVIAPAGVKGESGKAAGGEPQGKTTAGVKAMAFGLIAPGRRVFPRGPAETPPPPRVSGRSPAAVHLFPTSG